MIFSRFDIGNPQSLSRQLLVATLGGAGVRLLGTFVAFIIGLELARNMGPTEYGSYGTVVAVVTMLAVLATLGMDKLATRDVSVAVATSAFDDAKGTLVWFTASVTGASIILAVVGALIWVVWKAEPNESLMRAYYWGLASVPLLALKNLGVGLLRGYHKIVSAQTLDALVQPSIFAALLFVVSVVWGVDASGALAMRTAAALIAVAFCCWSIWRETSPQIRRAKPVAHWREWASSAAPMSGTEFIRTLDSQYALLIFGVLAPLHDVGVFRVALAVAVFIALPMGLVNWAVMPHAAQLYSSGDRKRLQAMASGAALVTFGTTLAATIALLLIGKPAITLVFGSAYRDSWLPLVVLALAYTVNGFFGSSTVILNMTGCERAVTRAYLVGLPVGVGLTVALYSLYGTTAGALALVASELVKGAMMWRVARDRLALDISVVTALREGAQSLFPLRARNI